MKPLVDYMISEMERAGFTPKRVNDALHTCMADRHWFTRGSQWELPTRENYERLRNLFNGDRLDGEYLCRDYEELHKDYEELRKDYEELRRPFNLPERSTDVLQFPQDSGASKRYGHDTVKGEAITSYLIQVTTRPGALVVVPFAGSGTECARLPNWDADSWGMRSIRNMHEQRLVAQKNSSKRHYCNGKENHCQRIRLLLARTSASTRPRAHSTPAGHGRCGP